MVDKSIIFELVKDILVQYIPDRAIEPVIELIKSNEIHLKIVRERATRHGDYRRMPNGQHQITVNANLNKYRFLITLIHEMAHLLAFKKFGRSIKPHGVEWKMTFQELMVSFINPTIFPSSLLPIIANHFRNPKASSDTDAHLSIALKKFDPENNKNYVFEIKDGQLFRIHNGRIFKKGNKRVKRYECIELKTGKVYLFNPNVEVELLN